jgi:hypothetical protein
MKMLPLFQRQERGSASLETFNSAVGGSTGGAPGRALGRGGTADQHRTAREARIQALEDRNRKKKKDPSLENVNSASSDTA